MAQVETLSSVSEAIALVCHPKGAKRTRKVDGVVPDEELPRLRRASMEIWAQPDAERGYSFPFGLWFRGQSNFDWGLQPAAYRAESRMLDGAAHNVHRHEASTHLHWRLLAANQRSHHRSDFDWLTLMRHHLRPSRVLDWSGNVLVGLYFAVGGNYPGKSDRNANVKKDGALYVLNARRLNYITSICEYDGGSIHIPSSLDAIMRATLAAQSRRMRWLDQLEQLTITTADIEDPKLLSAYVQLLRKSMPFVAELGKGLKAGEIDPKLSAADKRLAQRVWELLRCPSAIFPHRMNPRLIAQQGTFTLHGGKVRETGDLNAVDPHDLPISLEDVHDGKLADKNLQDRRQSAGPIFIKYRIPKKKKATILSDLASLGIHEATLFPGLDGQSMYVSHQWSVASKADAIGPDADRPH